MDDCVFCRIVKGEIPSQKVHEDDSVLAFYDINPVAPVHVLIVPKKHIINLSGAVEEDLEILGRCQLAAAEVAEKMKIKDAFRLLTANGKEAGQSVFHLHYHLIGGWENNLPKMETEKQKFP